MNFMGYGDSSVSEVLDEQQEEPSLIPRTHVSFLNKKQQQKIPAGIAAHTACDLSAEEVTTVF